MTDGPNPLQKREGVSTILDNPGRESLYESERAAHLAKKTKALTNLKQAMTSLTAPSQDGRIVSPRERRADIFEIKKQLKDFNEFKQQ